MALFYIRIFLTLLCIPLSFSLLQNRRTTTSDFVVFVVFVGILKWYTFVFRPSFYIGWGRAGRACPVGSFAKQISSVLRPPSSVGAEGLAPFLRPLICASPVGPLYSVILHNFFIKSLALQIVHNVLRYR